MTDGDLISKDKLLSGIYSENPEDVMKYIADFTSVQPKSVPIAVIKLDTDEIVQKVLDEIQPSGDLISRQSAINACQDGWNYDGETIKHIQENLRKLPTITTKDPLNRLILSDRWEEFNRWLKEREREGEE